MNSLVHDVRIGARRFKREPAFAVLASLTLALGIGFTTTVFGIAQAALFNPVPYVDGTKIVVFQIQNPASPGRGDRGWLGAQEFVEYRSHMSSLAEVIGISSDEEVVYAGNDGAELLRGASVSGNTFRFFGVSPVVGRGLTVEDARPGATPVFAMSYRMWSTLGRDSTLLNRNFVLNGVATTLVGVMPERFALSGADLWRPVAIDGNDSTANSRAFAMLARLKDGATLARAEAEFRVVAARLAPAYPRLYPKGFVVRGMTLVDNLSGRLRPTLRLFAGAVALLLLIACANVANMLLARATQREREMAIRSSLGATRSLLIRQLLVESALLALVGGGVGCLFAHFGMRALVALAPNGLIPPEAAVGLNGQVLAFNLAITVATVLIFGLVPALRTMGRDLTGPLKGRSRSMSTAPRVGQLNSMVVIAAVALSLVLLTGAGLLFRTSAKLRAIDLGFEAKGITFYRIRFPPGRYRAAAQKEQLLDQVLERVRALPGVASATAASAVPLDGGIRTGLEVPGADVDSTALALVQLCSDGYFATVGLRLRSGRALSAEDVSGVRKVAVVNEALAQRYFGRVNPVGKYVRISALLDKRDERLADPTFEIVGVVADTKNHGIRASAIPESFVPASISGAYGRSILLRTAGEQSSLGATVRRELWAIDRTLSFARAGSVEDMNRFSYAEPRFSSFVVVAFATVALLLVTLGIYGVITYTVSRQTHEIGVRIALGATRGDVLWMVLRKGLLLVGLGIIAGLAASIAVQRVVGSQLWGVQPYDPLTFGLVSVVVLVVGFAASFLPALRAVRVDPAVALRAE